MNKYALIGKDIAHSRSPEIYKKIISSNVDYSLLDYGEAEDIPTVKELFATYDGINITSPYKKHFLSQIRLTKNATEVGAVNCLKKENNEIVGENTDYLAIIHILNRLRRSNGKLNVVILGDGVMSFVTQVALKNLGFDFNVYSRKLTQNFSNLNLDSITSNHPTKTLIINTCARDFIFHGKLPITGIFWDFNYNFKYQENLITPKVEVYIDGSELLEQQALYAVAFWSSLTSI